MKKSFLIAAVSLLILVFAVSLGSAATPTGSATPAAPNQSTLTEAQKQELAPLYTQMNDLRKQMFEVCKQIIQKQVSFGNMTQAQADQHITWMKNRLENNAAAPGMMMGQGMHSGHGFHGNCPAGY